MSSVASKDTMQAVLVRDGKGPSTSLYIGSAQMPKIEAEDDVLVSVKAAGVNRMDILQREGQYPLPPGAPTILGVEFSGHVLSAGPAAASKFPEGTPVFGLALGGAYAEVIRVKSSLLLPKPAKLTFEQAASIPENWLTAFQALRSLAHLQRGEDVLIHAGASGVSLAALQLARDFGARRVYSTAGTDDKCRFCEKLGADRAFNYKALDWGAALKEETKGEGVDVIMDFIGASYWDNNLASLKRDGRLVMQGAMGGIKLKEGAPIGPIIFKRLSIIGSTLRSRSLEYQGDLVQSFLKEGGLDKIMAGADGPDDGSGGDGKEPEKGGERKHHLVIHKVFDWKDVQEAHREMEQNKNTGKIILRIS